MPKQMSVKPVAHKTGIGWKVVSTFAIVSLGTGLLFALVVSRPTLQKVWFRHEEYWVLPTTRLLLLATTLFWLSLAGAYVIAHVRRWLSFSAIRSIFAFLLTATIPLVAWLVEPLGVSAEFFLFRTLLVLLLAVTLFVITQKWYWGIAILMLAISLVTPLLASLQYVVFRAISAEWFEISEFLVGSLLLSVLFACWLTKSIWARSLPAGLFASSNDQAR